MILTKPGLGACSPNLSIISPYNLILLQVIKLNVSEDENSLVQVKLILWVIFKQNKLQYLKIFWEENGDNCWQF